MVGLVSSSVSTGLSLTAASFSSQQQNTSLRLGSGRGDSVNLSPEARRSNDLAQRLGQNAEVLRGQRIGFLQQQLRELNDQIATLRGFLEFANAGQAENLRSGIADVGRQIDGIGGEIGLLVESSSTSIEIEQVQGAFSQSFNAAALGQGSAVAYSQQLEGEFSFTRITVQEETQSLALVQNEDGSSSLQIQTSVSESEIVVASASLSSEETLVSASGDDSIANLISLYEDTGSAFESLVDDTLEALDINDGGIDQLLSFLDDFIERNKIDTFA